MSAPRNRKRLPANIAGNHGSRSDYGTVTNLDWRDQGCVGPHKGILSHPGLMLGNSIVVAGDRTGTDVGARANLRVTNIGQMVDLGILTDKRCLDLDKIPDAGTSFQFCPGTKACKGSDNGVRFQIRPLDMAEAANLHTVSNRDARTDKNGGAKR